MTPPPRVQPMINAFSCFRLAASIGPHLSNVDSAYIQARPPAARTHNPAAAIAKLDATFAFRFLAFWLARLTTIELAPAAVRKTRKNPTKPTTVATRARGIQ